MTFRNPVTAILLLAGLLVSGCDSNGRQVPAGPAAPQVTVAHPLVHPIIDWDDYIGQFEAEEQVDLRPRVTGYLVGVHFQDGDFVEAGQLLFTIDPRPFEAVLDQARSRISGAEARLVNARAELERARSLVDIQAVSTEEVEALESTVRTAESELEAAQAGVRSAELDVLFTRIRAPISGRASQRRVDIGNAVKADDTVLTSLVSVDPMHFAFQGSEALYLKYKRSDLAGNSTPVRIRLQDESDYQWFGHIDFMDNRINADTGTILGRAVVPNPDGFLTPGMFGHLQLQASREYDGILIPDTAIGTRGAQRIVYLVDENNTVSTRQVTLGPLYREGLRIIREGLNAEDRLVINGIQRAFPGQQVQPIDGVIEAPATEETPAPTVSQNANTGL